MKIVDDGLVHVVALDWQVANADLEDVQSSVVGDVQLPIRVVLGRPRVSRPKRARRRRDRAWPAAGESPAGNLGVWGLAPTFSHSVTGSAAITKKSIPGDVLCAWAPVQNCTRREEDENCVHVESVDVRPVGRVSLGDVGVEGQGQ